LPIKDSRAAPAATFVIFASLAIFSINSAFVIGPPSLFKMVVAKIKALALKGFIETIPESQYMIFVMQNFY
jgi:hypothetical protein